MRELILSLFIFFLFACANVGNISGGQKDELPPELIASIPANGSVNTYAHSIELFFNENIQIKNISQNLLVSPALKNKPIIKQKAKSIQIEIVDSLLENTTYTLNFGNAIQDLNEGNALNGFSYVFSTGDSIDQGKISGYVKEAFLGELEEVQNTWALLYKNISDTAVLSLFPDYVAPIEEENQSFSFKNIKEGEYKVYVVKDQNANYRYDLPNESIAFLDSIITIDSLPKTIEKEFRLFTSKDTLNRVLSEKQKENAYTLQLSQPVSSYQFFDSLSMLNQYPINQYKDSITFYYPLKAKSNPLYIKKGTKIIDTVLMKAIAEDFVPKQLKPSIDDENILQQSLRISFPYPIHLIDSSKITVLEDSLYVAGGLSLLKDSLLATTYHATNQFLSGKQYIITCLDSAFTSIYNTYSDSITITVDVPKLETLSTVSFAFAGEPFEGQLILQLLKNEKVVIEDFVTTPKETVSFTYLQPGSYTLRIIHDTNSNGSWDTGDYKRGLQPEKVSYYTEGIELRANWDVELEIEY